MTYSQKAQVSISLKPPRPLADMGYPEISKGTTSKHTSGTDGEVRRKSISSLSCTSWGWSVTFDLWIWTWLAFKYCTLLLTFFSEYMDTHLLLCWRERSPIFSLSGLYVIEISSEMSSMCHVTAECMLKGHVISHHLRAPVWPLTSQTGIMTSNNNTVWGSDPKRQSSWHACHLGLRDFTAVCDRTEIRWYNKPYERKLFYKSCQD